LLQPIRAIRGTATAAFRSSLLWASRRPSVGRLAAASPISRGVVSRFVAGETSKDAIREVALLRDLGFHTTVDILGEVVGDSSSASAAAEAYLDLLGSLHQAGLEPNVSLKLTQLGLDLDREICRSHVQRVATTAAGLGGFVRIDMEDHARVSSALELGIDLRGAGAPVGVVTQAYLRRSASDLDQLIASGMPVRLCKGAYAEPPTVAFPRKSDVDRNFIALAGRLLRDGNNPALATHDASIIESVIAFVGEQGIARRSFEFQMLYGIRRDLQRDLRAAGYRVRIYVPYGPDWYPYFMRRLAERPANAVFVLGSVLRERRQAPPKQ